MKGFNCSILRNWKEVKEGISGVSFSSSRILLISQRLLILLLGEDTLGAGSGYGSPNDFGGSGGADAAYGAPEGIGGYSRRNARGTNLVTEKPTEDIEVYYAE